MEADKLARVFGDNLRRRRRELGMTQADLSAVTGIHAPDISDLEQGKRSPNLATIARIAEALSLPPSQLLSTEALASI